MANVITVEELYKHCKAQIAQGNGKKKILLSSDDEGNEFHEGKFRDSNGRFLSKQASLEYLETKAEEYSHEGWRLFGVMRKLIEDAGININKKRQEWAMAKKIKH